MGLSTLVISHKLSAMAGETWGIAGGFSDVGKAPGKHRELCSVSVSSCELSFSRISPVAQKTLFGAVFVAVVAVDSLDKFNLS